MNKTIRGVILDVDGTLIDSNDAHAHAFERAFEDLAYSIAYPEIRRLIGRGGKEIIKKLAGLDDDSEESKAIRDKQGEYFRKDYLPQLQAFPKAKELLIRMKAEGLKLVVGSSANEKDLGLLLEKIGITNLLDDTTSSSDVERAKPCPDILEVSLKKMKLSASNVLMLGDTPYDIEAARRADVGAVALRCGGWSEKDLSAAVAIYDDPKDLWTRFDSSPFAQ